MFDLRYLVISYHILYPICLLEWRYKCCCLIAKLWFRNIDYARLVKIYGNINDSQNKSARKYSPPECTEIKKMKVSGNPNRQLVSTSYAERQNLNMRMSMRRFTRLTNAFSKKVDNLEAAVALHFMYYNFCRIHKTLRVTPAMEAGISDHVWSLEEIIQLIDK